MLQSHLGIVADSIEGSYVDGRLECRFKREKTVNSSIAESKNVWDLRGKKYHFIVGSGPANETGIY